jgi:hypothetical protein
VNVTNAIIEAEHAKRMNMLSLLVSLEPLHAQGMTIEDASRVLGHFAVLQDKYIGAVSLCDTILARDVCELIMEEAGGVILQSSRTLRQNKRQAGIAAAIKLGWLDKSFGGALGMKCWWYDSGSIERATNRHGALAHKVPVGFKGLEEMLHAKV